MGEIKLFQLKDGVAGELKGRSAVLERTLQRLIEANMDELLAITFLASEHSTGRKHRGRIDSLGMDENGYPVIIEYKRTMNENVINQGLFYMDWLLDHKAEFKLMVMDRLGTERADSIDWSSPRLLCIAGDFTRYDEHAVLQMEHNVELIRYRQFGDEMLLLELVNASSAGVEKGGSKASPDEAQEPAKESKTRRASQHVTAEQTLSRSPPDVQALFEELQTLVNSFGDDVQLKVTKRYFAFKRLRNFLSVEFKPRDGKMVLYAAIDPDTVPIEDGFTRDVRNVGHWGTGDLKIVIKTEAHLRKAEPLLKRAYDGE